MKTRLSSVLLLLLLFSGCAKKQEIELVGTWVRQGDGKEVTLTPDGVYVYQLTDNSELKGMWRLDESGGLEIGIPNFDAEMLIRTEFKINGSTLTITDEKGREKVFEKKI